MLTIEQVGEVNRLLEEGRLSRRGIARAVGVSRGTVNTIANGKRGFVGLPPAEDLAVRSAVAQRCPGCGGKVFMPCVYCEAIAHRGAVVSVKARAA